MREVKLKYQYVMSIITHYYSNSKCSRDKIIKIKSFPESRVYKLPHVCPIRLFVVIGLGMADPNSELFTLKVVHMCWKRINSKSMHRYI